MGKLLPVLIAATGLVAGTAGGYVLRPAPAPEKKASECGPTSQSLSVSTDHAPLSAQSKEHDFVKLDNQFIVPLVQGGKVTAMVVLSITLEVIEGSDETVYKHEPKIRDEFLQVMFNHANSGGFDGVFTDTSKLTILRRALLEVATGILENKVHDVLISNIVRQDQ